MQKEVKIFSQAFLRVETIQDTMSHKHIGYVRTHSSCSLTWFHHLNEDKTPISATPLPPLGLNSKETTSNTQVS